MTKTAYLYVFDTMADWETGYLIAELNSGRFFKKELDAHRIKTLGLTSHAITTMGGVKILPDVTVEKFTIDNASILILPGGNTWLETIHNPILSIAKKYIESNLLVAAICGATAALAEAGLLDHRNHTSNDLNYLKAVCPNYKGEANYQSVPAVTDRNLITATGTAPLEFAYQTLKCLDVFSTKKLEAWYNLNRTNEARYFFELMETDNLSIQ